KKQMPFAIACSRITTGKWRIVTVVRLQQMRQQFAHAAAGKNEIGRQKSSSEIPKVLTNGPKLELERVGEFPLFLKRASVVDGPFLLLGEQRTSRFSGLRRRKRFDSVEWGASQPNQKNWRDAIGHAFSKTKRGET